MATLTSTQTDDKWFSTMLRKCRSTKRKRKATNKTNRVSVPTIIGIPSKGSFISVESDEVLATPPPEPEFTPIPTTQKAFTVAAKRKYAMVDDFPTPQLQHHKEVIVRNHAVALNPIDWKSVDYNFCLPAFPWVTGRESAGVVVNVGSDVKTVKPGDRVWTSECHSSPAQALQNLADLFKVHIIRTFEPAVSRNTSPSPSTASAPCHPTWTSNLHLALV
jgi:hypothetical protein